MTKTAVVLFNLGAPDCMQAVEPFLKNLFNDPAILRMPSIFRLPLSWILAKSRRKEASKIYAYLGGKSPLRENTQAQADALSASLGPNYKVFIAMRYWHPFASETLEKVKQYDPDRLILLPLYPHFSTTTTASSLDQWHSLVKAQHFLKPTTAIGCYPVLSAFVQAMAESIDTAMSKMKEGGQTHLLFSAHGLPESIVHQGDPYPLQVNQTVEAVVAALKTKPVAYSLSYQSRVGPVPWIGPYTDEVIQRKGEEKKSLVLVPIAFTSEHSETLYEMDVEYKKLAETSGVPQFERVSALGTHQIFIEGLATLCRTAEDKKELFCPCYKDACLCKKFLKNG